MQKHLSRRTFLLAGSASTALWLTGCGGGGSADSAPWNQTSATSPTVSTSCTAATVDAINGYEIAFTGAIALPNASIPLSMVSAASEIFAGTTNAISSSEGLEKELFISFIQPLTAAQTCSTAMVRTLRLHLSIPQDTTADTIEPGDVFAWGDPTSPGSSKVFTGELIVTDPSADDGANCWAYKIMSGTITVVAFDGLSSAQLELSNVVATASLAGSANNAAYAGGGQFSMNGQIVVPVEPLLSVINVDT